MCLVQQDQMLMSHLISSLSEDVLSLIVGLSSSHAIWTTLEAALASPSNTLILQLLVTLQQLHQEDKSISVYLHKAKLISEELVAAGCPLSTTDFNIYIFKGLQPEFKELVTTVAAQTDPISFSELNSLLLCHEFLHRDSFSSLAVISHVFEPSRSAHLTQRGGSSSTQFRRNSSNHGRNGQSSGGRGRG
ncbi:hypothetical protein Acr_05g0011750 [Actinidia rufa]|uniref:UBN2 domain-containing protein n=1 Tax=Actinidia rufa TaxID=165716 RepID=A0A7J0EN13_9ERIC|nr:hypothetical protein Acr_05g0011750 [Actinidia rufa]